MGLALLLFFNASAATLASGQLPAATEEHLEAALTPGLTAWITDATGREERIRIVAVSNGIVTIASDGSTRRLRTSEVVRVQVRHSDSVLNGALIGAGAAVAAGLFLCTLTESWENCRDDVGPMLRIAGIGAGAGIAVDALIRGRRTIYPAPAGSLGFQVAPILSRRATGFRVSVSF